MELTLRNLAVRAVGPGDMLLQVAPSQQSISTAAWHYMGVAGAYGTMGAVGRALHGADYRPPKVRRDNSRRAHPFQPQMTADEQGRARRTLGGR